jgi:large subunit ribosomal protein L40e
VFSGHCSCFGKKTSKFDQNGLSNLSQVSDVCLDVESTDTMVTLRQKIDEKGGIPTDQQRILFGGKELCDDDRTIADHGIEKKSTIHLILGLDAKNTSKWIAKQHKLSFQKNSEQHQLSNLSFST